MIIGKDTLQAPKVKISPGTNALGVVYYKTYQLYNFLNSLFYVFFIYVFMCFAKH